MMRFKNVICVFGSVFMLAACSGKMGSTQFNSTTDNPNLPESGLVGEVIKATASIPVQVDSAGHLHSMATVNYPVTVVNPPNVSFAVDTSAAIVPVIKNAMLDFGKLSISALADNDLHVCSNGNGPSNKKCGQAFIRMYTTGTAGAGLWNATDAYGMPIFANKTGITPISIGLGAAQAAVVQTVAIPPNKHALTLADFVSPTYELHADFTTAGAGSYSTTLVIEYGLIY